MNETILTAMSGGVDSSVAAYLLLEQGLKTDGATMHFFDEKDIGGAAQKAACTDQAIVDARAVCDRLGIAHYVFDLCEPFKRCVMAHFADSYMRGDTPNPCIECNRTVKFPAFLSEAERLSYTTIATGHYARIEYDSGSNRYLLKKAVDASKDQSYVLYSLSQDMLSHTRLPLGALLKSEIREIAGEQGFLTADKPDSQDICFIPNGDYAAFLENIMGCSAPRGDFVREDGRIVGKHKGIHHYTIGQRKGLGIAAEKPLYVINKDTKTNTILLGDNLSLFSNRLTATQCNWIALPALTQSLRVTAKTRYKQIEAAATVSPIDAHTAAVVFDQPQRALTLGQAVVFYDGDTVIGGGTISL